MVQREGERLHILTHSHSHTRLDTHPYGLWQNPTRDPILCQRRIGLVPKADERSQITEPGLTQLLVPCTSVSICKIFTTAGRDGREGGKMSVTNCMRGKQIHAGENEGGM